MLSGSGIFFESSIFFHLGYYGISHIHTTTVNYSPSHRSQTLQPILALPPIPIP